MSTLISLSIYGFALVKTRVIMAFGSTFYALIRGQLYSKTCVKWPLSKRPKIGFQDQLSLNAGQTYSRMLQGGAL